MNDSYFVDTERIRWLSRVLGLRATTCTFGIDADSCGRDGEYIETTVPARIPALNLNLWMLPTVSWTFFHGDDPKELLFVNQIDGGAGSQADAPA